MIRDSLIPALKKEFPDQQVTFGEPPQPIAIFSAAHESVGKVIIYDDGDEATILIEKITHGHFNPYNPSLSEKERDALVTENVVEFLKALFSDQVLLHTTADNHIGGWTRLDLENGPVELSPSFQYFLWTRPYKS